MAAKTSKESKSSIIDLDEDELSPFDIFSAACQVDESAQVAAIVAETRSQPSFAPPPPLPPCSIELISLDASRPRIEVLSDPMTDRDFLASALAHAAGIPQGAAGSSRPGPHPSAYHDGDEELQSCEIIIDANGQPRQAGADSQYGEYVKRLKRRSEQNLFIFLKGVLGRFFLTSHFHKEICHFIQKCPPFRKLVLMPREHAKTTIVAGGLPIHILIQSADTNIYFPGLEGSECRILLAGETETMAKKNLRVVASTFEENKVLRALWPERVWEQTRESRQWSSEAIIIPRKNEWPDPTIRAVGVGGAVTGARPNVMIKDDLVSFKAANSEVTMDEAIEWHKASRALLDKYEIESGLQSLEFIIGTRWAVYDLYSYIMDNDPSVEVNDPDFHKIINDGRILWHEKYSREDIAQLQREHGSNFYLLYLNSVADPELTDFNLEQVRDFRVVGNHLIFDHDERDNWLSENYKKKEKVEGTMPPVNVKRGKPLELSTLSRLLGEGVGVRLRG